MSFSSCLGPFFRAALFKAALVAGLLGLHPSLSVAQTVLTFEGLDHIEAVNDFYNGGTGGAGHSGANYGVSFANAVALKDGASSGSNAYNMPSPATGFFFLSGAPTLNVANGFDSSLSFYYTSSVAGSVTVYSGLNGTGTVLATIPITAQYNDGCIPQYSYCNWTQASGTFAGTAHSVVFGGGAGMTAYDNVTLDLVPPLAISTSALPAGQVGATYAPLTLAATGGTPAYTWSATGLPAGLSVSPAGLLSGTPTQAGDFNVTLTVTDAATPAQTQSVTLALKVAALTAVPTLNGLGLALLAGLLGALGWRRRRVA